MKIFAVAHLSWLVVLTGCLPFVSDHQSAALLSPGKSEVTPSLSYVSFSGDGETEHVQTHFGVRAAVGVAQSVELRGAYERVQVEDADDGVNVIGFGPKIGLVPNRVSLYLPFGVVTGQDIESSETWTAVPTLLVNAISGRTFELVPSIKAFVPVTGSDRDVFLGAHLGAGISNDLSRWALRPEVGFVRNPGEKGTTFGFSLGVGIRP